MRRVALGFAAVLIAFAAHATEIGIATFNTESDDDTQPAKVAETIGQATNVDIWALQEVEGSEAVRV